MLSGAFPAGLVQLGGLCGPKLAQGVGGGVEGGFQGRPAEGLIADDGGIDTLPEQSRDDTTDNLEPVGGNEVPLYDPMPSHPQLRPDRSSTT